MTRWKNGVQTDMSDEYIKREDAIKAFDPQQRRDWYTPWIVETLEDLPSADVAPVRHGRWDRRKDKQVCSLCGAEWYYHENDVDMFGYCPCCGARMDGDGNE